MNKGISIKKILASIMVIFTLFVCVNTITVMAAGSNFQMPLFLDKYDVYDGGSSYTPNYSDYPFNKNTVTAIGFDKLYDTDKSFFKYKGEVPKSLADNKDDKYDDFRTYDGDKIDGNPRPWSNYTKEELEANGVKFDDKQNLKADSTDPHIWAMTVSTSWFSLGSIVLAIVGAINWLFTMIVNLMISFKSFNIASLIDSLDGAGTLSKQLSQIFLIDPNTGSMSPFLIFGLVVFVFSFIALAIGVIKGRKSGRNVVSEFGFFVLAILIAGMYFNTTNAQSVSKIGIDFMTSLANNITSSASDSTSIFMYSTGDDYLDNSSTQRALISKTYIDQLINAQFGYNVNELYLINPDGSDGSFGTKQNIQDAMKATFGDEASADSMSVVTDTNGEHKINNLGYYLWAANTGVAIYDGTNQTKPAFYTSGSKTLIRTGSSDRMLYVVDFLSNLREIHKEADNKAMIAKIDTIMKHLTSPNYWSAVSNVFAVTIQNAALAFALFTIAIFAILGQMIITFGSYCMIIMPTLLLFNGTRPTAKKMMWSYLLGFLRYLIGSALFNTIIVVSTLLSQQGFMGIIISAVACLLLGKFGPNLIMEINMQITQLGRGKELRFMSNVYHGMDKGFGKYTNSARKMRNKQALILNEDGNVEQAGSFGDRVQEGIQKGENPFAKEKGWNPFGEKRKKYQEQMQDNWDGKQKVEGDHILWDKNEESGQNGETVNNQQNNENPEQNNSRNLINDESNQINNVNTGLGNTVLDDAVSKNNDIQNIDNLDDEMVPAESNLREGRSLLGDEIEDIDNENERSIVENEQKPINVRKNNDDDIKIDNIEYGNDNLNFDNGQNDEVEEIDPKTKIKDEKASERNLKLKNAGLKTVNKVPVVGPTLNKHIANKMAQTAKDKKIIKDTIEKKVVESNDKITLNQAFESAKDEILNDVSKSSHKTRIKSLNKAKESLNQKDVTQMKKNINLKKKEIKEKEELLEAAKVIKSSKEKENNKE